MNVFSEQTWQVEWDQLLSLSASLPLWVPLDAGAVGARPPPLLVGTVGIIRAHLPTLAGKPLAAIYSLAV